VEQQRDMDLRSGQRALQQQRDKLSAAAAHPGGLSSSCSTAATLTSPAFTAQSLASSPVGASTQSLSRSSACRQLGTIKMYEMKAACRQAEQANRC
jgi:hypothetical protein